MQSNQVSSLLQDLPELLPTLENVISVFCRGERELMDMLGKLSDRLLHISLSRLPSMSFWKSSAIASLTIMEFCNLDTWMQETQVSFKFKPSKKHQVLRSV